MNTICGCMPEDTEPKRKPFAPSADTNYITGDLPVSDAKRGYLTPDVKKPEYGRWANYGNSSRDSMDGDARIDVHLTRAE